MRYVAQTGVGGPEVLSVASTDAPTPRAGEVLIRVAAAGVNRPDLVQRSGRYPPPPGASPILGLEVSGTIAALGEGATGWKLGESVCALVPGGGYAEYVAVPASHVLPVPNGLSMIEAAAIPETAFTVWTNVFDRARLAPGESFLVHGGTSGIGTMAIQMAAARGHRVFATAGSEDKCAACRALGAEIAINHRAGDFVEALKEATGKRGVDVILDMVGGDYVARNLSLLAVEGRLVQIAFMTGSKPPLDLLPIMMKRLTLTGSTLRPRSIEEKAAIAASLRAQIWPLIEAGRVRPVIHATFSLDEAQAAHRELEAGQHIGKIVLTL